MQAAYADSHSHHDSHHNPSFHIEKGEGTVFVLLLQDTLCVLFIYLMKDESEKEEEDEAGLTDFEKPIMGCVKPVCRILMPAISQIIPAVMSNVYLETPYRMV